MYNFFKRLIDFILSLLAIIVLIPIFFLISLFITLDDGFPVFYAQERMGRNWKRFKIFKFRTMVKDADKKGLGITSEDDSRILKSGKVLRKFKLDELPQLFNVLIGNMSLVGPRPELDYYVNMFKKEYDIILTIKPGLTDYASIEYRDESVILDNSSNKEKTYVEKILPEKLALNKKYIEDYNFFTDIKILIYTIIAIFK
ncbi:MAG TPA: sugar transferase [Ignavibacteriaceae bacterium]|nr:sugar transferase [Ignavibacteriaceae bacterium]